MKKIFTICVGLLISFFGVPAMAADSVEVEGMVFSPSSPKTILLQPGQEVRVGEKCSKEETFFTRTKVCLWKKTVTATADSIVVTEGGTELSEQARVEVYSVVLSITLMMVAIGLQLLGLYYLATIFSSVTLFCTGFAAFAAADANIASLVTLDSVALLVVLVAVLVSLEEKKKGKFYLVAIAHSVIMGVALLTAMV